MTAVVAEPAPVEVEPARERQTGLAIARCDVPRDLQQMLNLAEILANARTVPRHFQRVEDVVVVMMAAQALDVPIFWALQAFHSVEGKLGMEATFMRALLYRAGGDFDPVENTSRKATVRVRKPGAREWSKPLTVEYGEYTHLHGKDNWKKNPRAMLMARATTTALRLYAPGVLMGFNYSPDELEEADSPTITATVATVRDRKAATASDGATAWLRAIADATTLDQINELWKTAGDKRLDAEIDGLPLRRRLIERGNEISAELARRAAEPVDADVEPDPDPDDDTVDAETIDDDPGPGPGFPAAAPPATIQLSCGCDGDEVFATGNHARSCPRYTVPVPAADPRGGRRR